MSLPSIKSLAARVAELEAELAKQKKRNELKYDYTKPRNGDLFRTDSGVLYMAADTGGDGVIDQFTLFTIAGDNDAGGRWKLDECFDGQESKFAYLGNLNDTPNLLKESL